MLRTYVLILALFACACDELPAEAVSTDDALVTLVRPLCTHPMQSEGRFSCDGYLEVRTGEVYRIWSIGPGTVELVEGTRIGFRSAPKVERDAVVRIAGPEDAAFEELRYRFERQRGYA